MKILSFGIEHNMYGWSNYHIYHEAVEYMTLVVWQKTAHVSIRYVSTVT